MHRAFGKRRGLLFPFLDSLVSYSGLLLKECLLSPLSLHHLVCATQSLFPFLNLSILQAFCCHLYIRHHRFLRGSLLATTIQSSDTPPLRQQPNQATQSILTDQWIHLILSYAFHRNIYILKIEDAEIPGNDWDEVLRNERINSTFPYALTHHFDNFV
jgi:ESCRT-II complex subunit